MKNKDKFINPQINIFRFSDTVHMQEAVTASVGSYAAGAIADYVTKDGFIPSATQQQITTLKSICGFKY